MMLDLSHGCFGPLQEGMCGITSFALNIPGALIGYVLLFLPTTSLETSLDNGFWTFISILLGDAVAMGAMAAFATSARFLRHAIVAFVLLYIIALVCWLNWL
jgi:hypothetical protein